MLLLLLRAYDNSSTQTESSSVAKGFPLMKQEGHIKNIASVILLRWRFKDVGGLRGNISLF